MKKILCLAIMLCIVGASVVGCANFTDTQNDGVADGVTYVSLRINPEIELVIDGDGVVCAVNAINADGETVLAELELTGLTAEAAGEAFTNKAVELGFIALDAENATVYILADGADEELANEIKTKIADKVDKYFNEKGIFGKAADEVVAEFENKATEWGVNAKEARMIARILELYPEMTAEEVVALSFEERVELIKDDAKNNGMTVELREKYSAEIEALREEYADMFAIKERMEEIEDILEDYEEDDDDKDEKESEAVLTEEELEALKAEYKELKAQYEAMKKEFHDAVKAAKDEKREKAEEARKAIVEKAKERREQHEEAVRKHFEEMEKNREEIESKIKDWRDKLGMDDDEDEDKDEDRKPQPHPEQESKDAPEMPENPEEPGKPELESNSDSAPEDNTAESIAA